MRVGVDEAGQDRDSPRSTVCDRARTSTRRRRRIGIGREPQRDDRGRFDRDPAVADRRRAIGRIHAAR